MPTPQSTDTQEKKLDPTEITAITPSAGAPAQPAAANVLLTVLPPSAVATSGATISPAKTMFFAQADENKEDFTPSPCLPEELRNDLERLVVKYRSKQKDPLNKIKLDALIAFNNKVNNNILGFSIGTCVNIVLVQDQYKDALKGLISHEVSDFFVKAYRCFSCDMRNDKIPAPEPDEPKLNNALAAYRPLICSI